MRTLETNDWILLNSIIYKIYTTPDIDQMRQNFLEMMKMLIDFDSADFYLPDAKDPQKLVNPVMLNCRDNFSQIYEELDYSRGLMQGGRSLIYRETDIIKDSDRIKTEYYKKVYMPNKWHYSLQMVLASENRFVGVVTFYRYIGKMDFEYNDVFLLDMLKEHLSFRLNRYLSEERTQADKYSVEEAADRFHLTKRETEILRGLLAGGDAKALSEDMQISSNTVRKHIINLYRKLGIRNRMQIFSLIRE